MAVEFAGMLGHVSIWLGLRAYLGKKELQLIIVRDSVELKKETKNLKDEEKKKYIYIYMVCWHSPSLNMYVGAKSPRKWKC